MLIHHDVSRAREHLNFSTWGPHGGKVLPTPNQVIEICDAVSDGSMPPWRYRLLHPNAELSARDVAEICKLADVYQKPIAAQ
jgi:hypothetical protein